MEEQDTANDIKAVTKEFENVQRSLAPFKVGPAARAGEKRGEGARDGGVSREPDSGAGGDGAHRGGLGCAERDGDADRKCRAVRAGAIAPVARAHRARRARELLHFDFRREKRRGAGAAENSGGDKRRIQNRGGGLEIARAGRIAGARAKRRAEIPFRQSGGGFGFDPSGAGTGGEESLS